MFRIGEFSKLTKLSIKALRYYDQVGLLKPAFVDSVTAYRYYTEEQLETVEKISAYKAAGLTNERISEILTQPESFVRVLENQKYDLQQAQQAIDRQLANLNRLLNEELKQEYCASLVKVEKQTVYCCRGYIADIDLLHSFIVASMQELRRTNPEVAFPEPDYCCVRYPDEGYRENDIFVEYVQSVDRIGVDSAVIKFKELEPITAVSVLHKGRYSGLREAYRYAIQWAKEQKLLLCGEARERYIHGKWDRENETEWLTEIQLPVQFL